MQTKPWMDGRGVKLGDFVMPGLNPIRVIELRVR